MSRQTSHVKQKQVWFPSPDSSLVKPFSEREDNGTQHRQKTYTASWTRYEDIYGHIGSDRPTHWYTHSYMWMEVHRTRVESQRPERPRGTWTNLIIPRYILSISHLHSEPQTHRQASVNTGTYRPSQSLSLLHVHVHAHELAYACAHTESLLPRCELYSWAHHTHPLE